MADWLKNPWIEKAIYSFYDKDAAQPSRAKAQIIQFNKIPCEKSASAEALLSDKWMYVKAIFTPQAIEIFEKSRKSKECGLTLCDIKGGLIFLNEYKVVPHVDYAKGVWEHLLIVNKFSLKCSEKNSQFGSELINSAAHVPFQVRIKKHFQLKQLAQLLHRPENTSKKLKLKDNKAFDVKAITNSFVERHQFVFIPEQQQELLDNIPEWRSNFCSPSTMDAANSLNTSLPSNQQVQNDVSMSSNTHQSDAQNPLSTSGFKAEFNNWNDGSLGLADLSEDDGTKIPDRLSPEMVQRSLHSTGVSCASEQHLELPSSQVRRNLAQLLYRDKDTRKLNLKNNKAFHVKAITNSLVERHQFVFIPDEQQRLLDNIPEWNNDFCPPSAMDTSNSLNTSLPSNHPAQDDVSMSTKTDQSDDQNDDHQSSGFVIAGSNDFHYSLKEPPPNDGMVGSADSCEHDGTYIRKPDSPSSPLEAVQTLPKSASVKCSLDRHLELPKSEQPCCATCNGGSLGNENKTKGKNRKEMEKRLRDIGMDIERSQSVNESSLMAERRLREENSASALTVQPPSTAYATALDVLENLEHQSDPFVCNSRARKRNSVADIVEENEEVDNWTQATKKDKLVRRSSIELALARQMKKQGEWQGRCNRAETSFNESSLSLENLDSKEKAGSGQECGARLQGDFQQGNSTTKAYLSDVSRFWLEFSQSQPLDLDNAGDECMTDFAVGDQVDIVVEDATSDARRRFVKKVFSVSKEACHSLCTSVGTQATKSFEDDKEGDKTTATPLGQESREQSRNHPQADISSRSVMVSGNIDDGYAATMRNEACIPGHTTWTPSRDGCERIKGLGAHGSTLENTLNSQRVFSRNESLGLKGNDSFRQRDRFVRTSGDGAFNSQFVSRDETRGGDARVRTSQVQKQEQDENARKRWNENMKDANMKTYDESCSVAAEVVQSLRRPEKKKDRKGRRGTIPSVPAGKVSQTDDQELSKKSRDKQECNVGELSAAGVADKQSSSCTEVSFILNTISGGSPSEQKSDESFSILKDTSISDLSPGGFKPAFTSTARQASLSANPTQTLKAKETRKGLSRAEGSRTSTKKHVTFGKRTVYSDKHQFEESPHNNDPLDENAIIPCTQQEDDSQLMTFQDPLQILKAMSPSVTKEDPKSKVLPCQATNIDKGDATERSYKDCNSDATRGLVGNVLQKKDKKTPKNDARRRQGHDRHAARMASRNSNTTRGLVGSVLQKEDNRRPKDDARRRQGHDRHAARMASRNSNTTRGLVGSVLQKEDNRRPKDDAKRCQGHDRHAARMASGNSDAACRQGLENAQPLSDSDASNDNDISFQASSITGDDNEIVLCSDESEELLHSPTLVAKDTAMQCIKQSSSRVYDGIVLGSEDSPYAMISSSPRTAAKQNILQCIKQTANDDSRADVTRTVSQSKQTSAGPGIRNTGRESLHFSLSDSQLTRDLNLQAEQENPSLLRSKKKANLKGRKSPPEGGCAVSTSPSSIPTSLFYKTESNSHNEKPQEGELRSIGCDVNMMSHPVDTNDEAECLMFVPGKGLETSSVCVTLVSREPAKFPRRNAESNDERNNSMNTEHVPRRQTRTQLSKEKNNAKEEQEGNQTVEKRRKLPQDCVSSTTFATGRHKDLDDGHSIPVKGAPGVNKAVAMETEISGTSAMSSYELNLVRGEGRLKRKRSQEDENRATKKLTTSAPSTSSALGCLNITKKKDQNEKVLNECYSSQVSTQYSCEHMLYSQQDPLILEFSSSENSDQDFSQESKIRDLLSSPILLSSPSSPESKTVPKSIEIEVSRCPETDSYMTEESCSPKFVSLPSYQVPTTQTSYLRHTNKQEDTTRGKTKPIIISDSEDDENENSFCWFSPR